LGVLILLQKVVALDTELGTQADRNVAIIILVVIARSVAIFALGVGQISQLGIVSDEASIVARLELLRIGPSQPAGDVVKATIVGDGVLADSVAVDAVFEVIGAGLAVHCAAQRFPVARVTPGGDLVIVTLAALGRMIRSSRHDPGPNPSSGVKPQAGRAAGDTLPVGDGESNSIVATLVGNQIGEAPGRILQAGHRVGRSFEIPMVRGNGVGQDPSTASLKENICADTNIFKARGDDNLTSLVYEQLGGQAAEIDGSLRVRGHNR
jgi:hypothetical protein